MKICENHKLIGRLQAKHACSEEKTGALAVSQFTPNGAHRCGAVEPGLPPLIGLRSFKTQNRLKLAGGRRRLSAPLTNLLGRGADLPALELQEPRSQRRNEPTPALVQCLDIPNLRELAQRALDLKGLGVI